MSQINIKSNDKTLEQLLCEYKEINKTLRETFDFINEYSNILSKKQQKKMEIKNETKKK